MEKRRTLAEFINQLQTSEKDRFEGCILEESKKSVIKAVIDLLKTYQKAKIASLPVEVHTISTHIGCIQIIFDMVRPLTKIILDVSKPIQVTGGVLTYSNTEDSMGSGEMNPLCSADWNQDRFDKDVLKLLEKAFPE